MQNKIQWSIREDGVLTIWGTGALECKQLWHSQLGEDFNFLTIKSVVIKEGITSVDALLFDGCSEIESIILPDSVQEIGAYAFWDCSNLKWINIPEGVKCLLGGTFNGCTSLKSVILPKSLTWINAGAFDNCPADVYLDNYEEDVHLSPFNDCDFHFKERKQ